MQIEGHTATERETDTDGGAEGPRNSERETRPETDGRAPATDSGRQPNTRETDTSQDSSTVCEREYRSQRQVERAELLRSVRNSLELRDRYRSGVGEERDRYL
ncbi:hypothetical protein NDU88_003714 [Pleurodeles waltl]|uniref:Uncharacterized protein n=1 Tax=Pleurodeles waltl TaxID=8319 RepID=A0AAV7QCI4_PLEWA|nr:hypothetical protein NDU88_003714 [Pleurodeles waltl]